MVSVARQLNGVQWLWTSAWLLLVILVGAFSFQLTTITSCCTRQLLVLSKRRSFDRCIQHVVVRKMSGSDDWSNFQALDDDEEIILGKSIDKTQYAVEDDSPETKAAVGSSLKAPIIDRDADPIWVPAGSQLELTEETVLGILSASRQELGTLFGYTAENRGVGITGGVDYVDMDGPTVIVRLKGRFWHTRTTVLERVANYLQQRIPEIVDVQVEDPWQLTDEANEIW